METISVTELRRLADRPLARVETRVDRVRLPGAYWAAFPDMAFSDGPPTPVVYDPADDVRDLRKEIDDPESMSSVDAPAMLWHALDHLSGLLGCLAAIDLNGELQSEPGDGR